MPIITDPDFIPQGNLCKCSDKQLDGSDPTACDKCYAELLEDYKRLEEEYKSQLEELTRIKSNLEPIYELVNQVTAHLVMAQIVKD